jgi:hypothetical protein
MQAFDQDLLMAISRGEHNDPFAVLGPHAENRHRVVRTFQPQAEAVDLVDSDGVLLANMTLVHSHSRDHQMSLTPVTRAANKDIQP